MAEEEKDKKEEEKGKKSEVITYFIQPDDITINVKMDFDFNPSK